MRTATSSCARVFYHSLSPSLPLLSPFFCFIFGTKSISSQVARATPSQTKRDAFFHKIFATLLVPNFQWNFQAACKKESNKIKKKKNLNDLYLITQPATRRYTLMMPGLILRCLSFLFFL